MATEKKQRTRYTQEDREKAHALFDQDLSIAEIERQTGVSDATLVVWKREYQRDKQQTEEETAVQQIQRLELELKLEKLQNRYLRRYANSDLSAQDKLELEIEHLIEFAKVFVGEWAVKRLSEAAAEEEG